jgi:tRNA threonylcarbamoyladenosine biosynthesis protein TsaB
VTKLLAIETATTACSAALSISGEVRERFEIAPQRHAELLLPMVSRLLAEAGLSPAQLDAVVFGRGPGAFTGVRIAAACAQGIAFGADLPVVPVSTLAILAQGALRAGRGPAIFVAMDARLNEVYAAAYRSGVNGLVSMQGEEIVCAPLGVSLPEGRWYGVGDGWAAYQVDLLARCGARLIGFDAAAHPHALDAVTLGGHIYRSGGGLPAEQALPVYLRDRVALKTSERVQGGAKP